MSPQESIQCLGLLLGREEVKVLYFIGSLFGVFSWISRLLTSLPWAVFLPNKPEFVKLLVIWWNCLFLRSGALHLVESTVRSLSLLISPLCITSPVPFPSPPSWPCTTPTAPFHARAGCSSALLRLLTPSLVQAPCIRSTIPVVFPKLRDAGVDTEVC